MKALGMAAYRFSIAWQRIFPRRGHQPNLIQSPAQPSGPSRIRKI